MIVVIFGQPGSGKTTLAKELCKGVDTLRFPIHIDGDDLRITFKDTDYTRSGRIKNLNRASDIAMFLNDKGHDPVLSLVYPYKEARDYLRSLTDEVLFVYLTYEGERGREKYRVEDFESAYDEKIIHIVTSKTSLENSLLFIEKILESNF
jgi:adenylylsulfate kinase-like enzyme